MSFKLESRFAHGDKVNVDFKESGILKNGEIERIIVAEDKISYDISFKIESRHGADLHVNYPVLCDVDSALVKPVQQEGSLLPAFEQLLKPVQP